MKQLRISSEKGQVLVLLVLAIFALMGFVALAVDGGNVYSSRRTAQNAADASALAGGAEVSTLIKDTNNLKWNCNKLITDTGNWNNAYVKAMTRATENGFTIENTVDNQNGVTVECVNNAGEQYVDVRVMITKEVPTAFLQIISPQRLINTVTAVVRVKPWIVFAEGAAIVATKDTCDTSNPSGGGVTFGGGETIEIIGGGIKSNACCRVNGFAGYVDITPGTNTWVCDETPDLNPSRTEANYLTPDPIQAPTNVIVDYSTIESTLRDACSKYTGTPTAITRSGTYGPGKYSRVDLRNSDTVTLTKGLYCIEDNFKVSGGSLTGSEVTIFMDTTAGIFTTDGGAQINLTAPPKGCENWALPCSGYGGLLILYLPSGTDSLGQPKQVTLGGNSTSNYEGTILAPKTRIEVGGTSSSLSEVHAQLVGETIWVHGNGTINIVYDPNYSVEIPSYLSLHK